MVPGLNPGAPSRVSAPVQIGREVYPSSCTMDIQFISMGLSDLSKGNFDYLGHTIGIVSIPQSEWSSVRILVGRKLLLFSKPTRCTLGRTQPYI
jgi:hypothetical protein